MEATRSKSQATMLLLSTVLGLFLGTSILLATKINNPPVAPIDTGLDYLLGKLVPEYDLEQLDGAPISTHLYQGNSHLVVFTLLGCDACASMYPILGEAATDIPILMIANTREGLKEKVAEHALAFPIAVDTLLVTMEDLNITNFPTALLVDRDQRIVEAVRGEASRLRTLCSPRKKYLKKRGQNDGRAKALEDRRARQRGLVARADFQGTV